CPTDSIQFGFRDELVPKAQKRVAALKELGYKDAQLYGADSNGPLGGLNAFFLLLDRPATYQLPEKPLLPQRNVKVDCSSRWVRRSWWGWERSWPSASAVAPPRTAAMLKSPDWHLLIVWYFFLGGIAGGAYFTAAIADNFGGPRDKSVIRIGYVLALLLIGLCGILLILDLGTPSRFMNMMMHFKFWDPMSIGAWMLGVFGLFAFVSSALSLVGGEGVAPVRRVVSLVGTIAGFFIAAYTGVLLSATALPLWREARLMGALFLASGASTGM